MADTHYELPELAALYDLENGWSDDADFYRNLPGLAPKSVLEVGCGTGLIARRLAADGHKVTGLDPARAMLDAGRQAEGGDRVDWIQGEAQNFATDRRFDYAFMAGHAFQCLLDDADITLAFANIARHLVPGGIFAFETRNPALPWEHMFEGSTVVETAGAPVTVVRKVDWRRGDGIRFRSIYRLADGEQVSVSTLRFATREIIETSLLETGFGINHVFGGWQRQPFEPETSREMIFVATWPN